MEFPTTMTFKLKRLNKEKNQSLPIGVLNALCHGYRSIDTIYGTFLLSGPDLRRLTVVVRNDAIGSGQYCTTALTPVISIPSCADIFGVPVWLPTIQRYGYWDEDGSQNLFLYPDGVTWQHIESHLSYYLSYENREAGVFPHVWDCIDVRKCFRFIPDNLQAIAAEIVSLPLRARQCAAQNFAFQYEPLVDHPFTPDLSEVYLCLLMMYIALGECYVMKGTQTKESSMLKAISWYERCITIIDRFVEVDVSLSSHFTSVCLLLSLAYSDINAFDRAYEYAEKWLSYDPTAANAAKNLKTLLNIKKESHAQSTA